MTAEGHVIDGTPIAVDLFKTHHWPQARLFFLTHFHNSRINGLSRKWGFPIYTSTITGKLLIEKIGVKPSVVKCLEIGDEHHIPMDDEGREKLLVTLYKANHCPGSVMFLFQGYFGNILYTGHFRYVPDLLDFSTLPEVDVLYLDNTYCSPKCIFPKWHIALDDLLQNVNNCLRESKRVFVGLDNIVQEDIFIKMSTETHTKIYLTPDIKETLDCLGLSDYITCDRNQSKILIVPTNFINKQNICKWNSEMKTCGILATAKYCGYNFIPYSDERNIHVVPISNHSSFDELVEFVKQTTPKVIIPVVGKEVRGIFKTDISSRADMSIFCSYLNDSPRANFSIPKSVESTMSLWIVNSQKTRGVKRHRNTRATNFKKSRATRGRQRVNYTYSSDSSETDLELLDDPVSHSSSDYLEENPSSETLVKSSSKTSRGELHSEISERTDSEILEGNNLEPVEESSPSLLLRHSQFQILGRNSPVGDLRNNSSVRNNSPARTLRSDSSEISGNISLDMSENSLSPQPLITTSFTEMRNTSLEMAENNSSLEMAENNSSLEMSDGNISVEILASPSPLESTEENSPDECVWEIVQITGTKK